jgi:hypothetical protein
VNNLQKYICAKYGCQHINIVGYQGMGLTLRCHGCNHVQNELPERVELEEVDHSWDGIDPQENLIQ